jgi:hypothetical protein
MEKGTYSRIDTIGIGALQSGILNLLDFERPITLDMLRVKLDIDDTPCNHVRLTRSLGRLRKRGLIKSLGRNSQRENLWVKKK